jgi:hypothetical protein
MIVAIPPSRYSSGEGSTCAGVTLGARLAKASSKVTHKIFVVVLIGISFAATAREPNPAYFRALVYLTAPSSFRRAIFFPFIRGYYFGSRAASSRGLAVIRNYLDSNF